MFLSAGFHYGCYFLLARKLVFTKGYEHRNVPRFALHMAVWPFLWSVGFLLGACDAPAVFQFLMFPVPMVASLYVWLNIFMNAGHTGYGLSASAVLLSLPGVGPAFALVWLAYSAGLSELFGFAYEDAVVWRERLFAAIVVLGAIGALIFGIHLKFLSS